VNFFHVKAKKKKKRRHGNTLVGQIMLSKFLKQRNICEQEEMQQKIVTNIWG
jgi:hypothetical protein